jgi:RES domain-containing protein
MGPWHGDVFRMVEAPYANERDLLSGLGAASRGQRWNPPGLLTAYACLDDTLAMLEWQEQRRKSGMSRTKHRPITQVTISASLSKVLNLRDPICTAAFPFPLTTFIAEEYHRQSDGDPEILAQALGRLAAVAGIQGLIVPAKPDPGGSNLVVYRPNLDAASVLDIYGKEFLPPPKP